jgi:hypothetical protein
MSWMQAGSIAAVAGLLLIGWLIHRPSLRLHITERGILDRRLRLGWIHWDEIEGAYEPTLKDRDSLRLRLRATGRLRRKLGRLATEVAPGSRSVDVSLDLSGSGITPVELLQRILLYAGPRHTQQS